MSKTIYCPFIKFVLPVWDIIFRTLSVFVYFYGYKFWEDYAPLSFLFFFLKKIIFV